MYKVTIERTDNSALDAERHEFSVTFISEDPSMAIAQTIVGIQASRPGLLIAEVVDIVGDMVPAGHTCGDSENTMILAARDVVKEWKQYDKERGIK